jgi:hypothetical protein
VATYLDYVRAELGANVTIYLQPQHWISADLGEAVIVESKQLLFWMMGADRVRATARTARRLPTDV